jgi:hypothetical protein
VNMCFYCTATIDAGVRNYMFAIESRYNALHLSIVHVCTPPINIVTGLLVERLTINSIPSDIRQKVRTESQKASSASKQAGSERYAFSN